MRYAPILTHTSIDTPGVIDRVSTLFAGHPELIQGCVSTGPQLPFSYYSLPGKIQLQDHSARPTCLTA